jgi:site-specific DNA-cytosine methylase
MLQALRDAGYTVDSASRSPEHVGVPQSRERIFLAGARNGLAAIVWPEKKLRAPHLATLLDEYPADAVYLPEPKIRALEAWQTFLRRYPSDEELPSFPIWSAEFNASYPYEEVTPWAVGWPALKRFRGTHGRSLSRLSADECFEALPSYAREREVVFPKWKERFIRQNRALYNRHKQWIQDWLPSLSDLPPSHQKLEWNCKGAERTIWKQLIQFRASGIRVKKPNSAPTLVAINTTQVPVVAWERRYMTPRECARIQGLSALNHLPNQREVAFRALGNAVNADLVKHIAKGLITTESARPRRPIPAAMAGGSSAKVTPATYRGRMPSLTQEDRINIRPPVSVLSVLRHLNYQPWYALAEFVDNSLQSFLANRSAIREAEGRDVPLRVGIVLDASDEGRIVIRDNAAGIAKHDFARAFRAAELPPDRTGLSELGMGMKSAACWFAPQWSVRTKALEEQVERTITFDMRAIVRDSLEELEIKSTRARAQAHYAEVVLSQVYKMPQKRTLGKIRDHLASMYRIFLREGTMELTLNSEVLHHSSPPILVAPYFKTPAARPLEWRKDILIDLGGKRKITGFAALREKGSTIDSGFALFRRKRVITGSADQGYRPEAIFGRSNSYIYQRLFGELHLTGFAVSHTKDGFRWEEDEEELLERLKEQLDAKPLPLLAQALGYRAKPSKDDLEKAAATVIAKTADALIARGSDTLETLDVLEPEERPPEEFSKVRDRDVIRRTIELERNGTPWEIILEACYDDSMSDWLEVISKPAERGIRRLGIRLALSHPFTERFGGSDAHDLEPMMRIAAALGLAETTAREMGVKKAGTVRVHFNELLREALARD